MSGKWGHPCGFAVDKLEFANDGKVSTETSLLTTATGLKLEFKANDSDKGDLGFIYKNKYATVTGELDTLAFSKAMLSITTGHGRYSAGAIANVKIAKSPSAPLMSTAVPPSRSPRVFLPVYVHQRT